MSRGTKIAILIVAGLIVIGLIFFFIILPVLKTAAPAPKTNNNANLGGDLLVNRNAPRQTNVPSNVPPPTEAPDATKAAAAARTIATAFAERLGTYDNRHDLINIDDLRTISTSAVWKYLDGEYRKSVAKTLPDPKDYYAMTSTAIRTDLVTADDSNVSAVVQMQRVESGSVTKVSFASLELSLKKVDGNWLVARLDWQK